MTREEQIEQKKQADKLLKDLKKVEKKKKLTCFEVNSRTVICLSDEEEIQEYKKKYNIHKK